MRKPKKNDPQLKFFSQQPLATPSSVMEEIATQKEQRFANQWHREHLQTPKEDSYSAAGTAGHG